MAAMATKTLSKWSVSKRQNGRSSQVVVNSSSQGSQMAVSSSHVVVSISSQGSHVVVNVKTAKQLNGIKRVKTVSKR